MQQEQPARDVLRGRLHQLVHGPGHRRRVVLPHLVPRAGRDLPRGAVRSAPGRDVPEPHCHVLRLGFGLVGGAVRGLPEHFLGELGGGRRHRDVGAPVPAGDENGPAVALGERRAAVVVARGAQDHRVGRQEGGPRPHPVDVRRVRVRLLARRETAEEQRVDDAGRRVAVVDVEPDRQRVVWVRRHAAMIRHARRSRTGFPQRVTRLRARRAAPVPRYNPVAAEAVPPRRTVVTLALDGTSWVEFGGGAVAAHRSARRGGGHSGPGADGDQHTAERPGRRQGHHERR